MSRRERLRTETTREIKAIARQQLAQKGAAGISLRGIARDMGMSAPSIYSYFDSYDALLTALIVDAFNALADAIEAADAAHSRDDHARRFRAAAGAYWSWGVANPQDYLLVYGTPVPDYHAPADVTGPASRRSLYVLLHILADGVTANAITIPDAYRTGPDLTPMIDTFSEATGVIFQPDVVQYGFSVWSRLHGLLSLTILRPSIQPLGDALHQQQVRAMLDEMGL